MRIRKAFLLPTLVLSVAIHTDARSQPVVPDADADWSAVDQAFGLGWFGTSAGDFDGDGYGDILLGDPGFDDLDDSGAAHIFFGSPVGLPGTGLPPVATTDDAFWTTIGAINSQYGWHVGSLGDVNGDGKDEVSIRSQNPATHYLFYGGAPGGSYLGADWTLENCAEFTGVSAGNVNADGYGDAVYHCGTDVGLFFGGPTGLKDCGPPSQPCTVADADWLLSNPGAVGTLPQYAYSAGDVDGDGYGDLIISFDEGVFSVLVFLGPLGGTAVPSDADWTFHSAESLKLARAAGDVNGDGYDDIAIQVRSAPGQVHLFHGSKTGLKSCAGSCAPSDADWTVSGVDRPTGMGDDLVWVGLLEIAEDFGGDGFDDLIVTARFDQGASSGNPGATIFFGGPDGLPNCAGSDPPSCVVSDAPWIVTGGPEPGLTEADVFAASAGDVNGDNGPDILVTYPQASGRAFVYHGMPDGDGDGFSVPGGDCDDGLASMSPGAVEVMDGVDNQCPLDPAGNPDPGNGVVDELTASDCNFTDPPGLGQLCWTRQSGATEYEIAASAQPAFGPDLGQARCSVNRLGELACNLTECCAPAGYDPLPGELFHFLARGSQPFEGAWGSAGAPPALRDVCPGSLLQNGDFEIGQCFGGTQLLNSGSRIPVDYAPIFYPGEPWRVDGSVELKCTNSGPWLSGSGSRDVALLNGNISAIRQTLATQPFETYTVTFLMGATVFSSGQVMLVAEIDPFGSGSYVDGTTFTFDVPAGGFDGSAGQWEQKTYQFMAQSMQTTLRFRTVTLNGGAPLIDAITVAAP